MASLERTEISGVRRTVEIGRLNMELKVLVVRGLLNPEGSGWNRLATRYHQVEDRLAELQGKQKGKTNV